jgi:hypothetical protein
MTALRRAGAGDVVTVRNGTYHERISFENGPSGNPGNPVVLQGESTEGVVIDGMHDPAYPDLLRSGGSHDVEVRNMTFRRGYAVSLNAGANLHIGGTNWKLVNVVSRESRWDGIIVGGNNTTLEGCIAEYNFAGGFAGGGSGLRNVLIKDCISRHNNCGWEENPFPGHDEIKLYEGKYHVSLAFTGGGGKFHTITNGPITFDGHQAYENHGAGLWFDWDNHNVIIRNSTFHDNKKLVEGWEGIGLMSENNPNSNITVEDCYFGYNECAEVLIGETQNMTLTNCTIAEGQLELRDMYRSMPGGDSEVMDISRDLNIEHNEFINAALWANYGAENWDGSYAATHNIVIDNNVWSGNEPQALWGHDANGELQWYNGLDDIRQGIGICHNDIYLDADVPVRRQQPGRRNALASAPTRVVLYDLRGRRIISNLVVGSTTAVGAAQGMYVWPVPKPAACVVK